MGCGGAKVVILEAKAAKTSTKGKRGGICASGERIGLSGTKVEIWDESTHLRISLVLLTTIVLAVREDLLWESMRRVSRLSGQAGGG